MKPVLAQEEESSEQGSDAVDLGTEAEEGLGIDVVGDLSRYIDAGGGAIASNDSPPQISQYM